MRLSRHQKAAILRLANPFWKAPRGDGRVQHGFMQTLYSLERMGLAGFRDGGYALTAEGRRLAKKIGEEGQSDPELRRLAAR